MAAYAPNSIARRPETLSAQVVAREPAAGGAVTLWLALPGTRRAPAGYMPGQFITLFLPASNGGTISRSYSLCGDGRSDQPWEITVKRQPGGLISPYLCERILPGMVLQTSAPSGRFTLPVPLRAGVPLVFVATGSGITPIVGLLRALARLAPAARPGVQFHYAYHSPADAIYGDELAALDPARQWLRQWHYVSTEGHRLTSARVLAAAGAAAPAAEWYICGAAALEADLEAQLLRRGVPRHQIHRETFASPRRPPLAQQAANGQGGGLAAAGRRIRLADSGETLTARPGETLLETLERCGRAVPSSCRAGACGTCRLKLLAGQVRNGDGAGLTPAERAQGYVLSCVAEPASDVVLAGAGSGGAAKDGARVARPVARRSGRRAMRGALLAASLAIFVGAGHEVLHTAGTQASGSSSGSGTTTQPSSSSSSSSSGGSSGGSSSSSSGGSGSVTTGPSQPGSTSTSSGIS